jgi:FdhE protein
MPKKKKSDTEAEKVKKRVEAMIKERPSHKEVLRFYKDVITEQYKIKPKIKITTVEINKEDSKLKIVEGFPLVEKKDLTLDLSSAKKLFKRLCKILGKNEKASRDIERINTALKNKDINLSEVFMQTAIENQEYVGIVSNKLHLRDGVLSFIARQSIKPAFEAYADQLKGYVDQEKWWRNYCPICGSEPFLAEFKKDGARFLVCSCCGYEWRFHRLKCPFCENNDHEKLRYFYTEKEGRAYRIDVCEKCKRYIKTVDTNEVGEVIPPLEDIGTLHLDVLAQNEGYKREEVGIGLS